MFVSLQALRGIAALLVLFHHVVQNYYSDQIRNRFWDLMARHGGFGVEIFFVLSGFIMAYSSEKYNGQGLRYAINRFIRILPNYWLFTALQILSLAILPAGTYLTDWTARSLVLSLLLIPSDNPAQFPMLPLLCVGWSLTYEMFFYLVLAATLRLKPTRSLMVCCAILFALVLAARLDLLGLGRWNPLGIGFWYLLNFVSGMLLFQLYRNRSAGWRAHLAPAGALVLALGLESLGPRSALVKLVVASALVGGCILAEPLFRARNPLTFALKWLGDRSYSIYLCHLIVIGWFFARFGNQHRGLADLLINLGMVGVTLLVSHLSYTYVETGALPALLKRHLEGRLHES